MVIWGKTALLGKLVTKERKPRRTETDCAISGSREGTSDQLPPGLGVLCFWCGVLYCKPAGPRLIGVAFYQSVPPRLAGAPSVTTYRSLTKENMSSLCSMNHFHSGFSLCRSR